MKRKTLIFFVIIFGLFLISSPNAIAAKKAVYPDPKSLHPVDKNIQPNISGNTNSTTEGVIDTSSEPDYEKPKTNSSPQIQIEKVLDKKISSNTWFIIFFIFIISIVLLYKKLKSIKV